MRTKAKRLLAFVLCLLMLASTMAIPAFAKGTSSSGGSSSSSTTSSSDVSAILNALSYDDYEKTVLAHSAETLYNGLVDVIRVQYPELKSDEIYAMVDEAYKDHKIELVINPEEGNDKQFGLLDGEYTVGDTTVILKDDKDRYWEDYASEKYESEKSDGIVLGANGTVTWTFNLPKEYAGNYTIEITYAQVSEEKYAELNSTIAGVENDKTYTLADKLGLKKITNNAIERIFYLNGEIPFAEARALVLSKLFTYDYIDDGNGNLSFKNEKEDGSGDDIRPAVIQKLHWTTSAIVDADGYRNDPFEFYFKPGENTISLQGEREDMVIKSITLRPLSKAISYSEYLKTHQGNKIDFDLGIIEAEAPNFVSSVTMYPVYDRTSAITSGLTGSQSATAVKYNTAGKEQWQNVGEWLEYQIEVPETGYYSLAIRYKQSLLSGMYVSRKLYIDGEVPFAEAASLRFYHSNSWQMSYLGDGKNAYDFYLEKGVHTIRLEATLGDMGPQIKQVNDSLAVINNCYLEIIKLTGTSPDANRSYGFTRVMPHVMEAMLIESQNLKKVYDYLVEQNKIQEGGGTGEGEKTATIKQVYQLLEKMATNESEIPANLATLKSQIGSLGTWINSAKTQPLQVDYFKLQSSDKALPKTDANFFQALWFEIKLFFASFALDYSEDEAAESGEGITNIEVWVVTGRDQAQIIRNLIENKFTPTAMVGDSRISVSIKLISGGTLLPSIIAGVGPEVSLMEASSTIIDYALRNAIKPLNEYINNDIDAGAPNILDEFPAAALEPLTLYDFRYGEFDSKNDGNAQWVADKDLYRWRDDDRTSSTVNYLIDVNKDANGNVVSENKYGYNWEEKNDKGEVVRQGIEIYALPDSLTFSMMFYRKDVITSLELDIPKTWDDMLAILPILQFNNMEIGIQNDAYTFIYQNGYEAYANNGMQINFDDAGVTSSFKQMCNYYTEYSLPYTYDFANRFRTGEMPIGIAPYTTCNQLSVFASELSGLWTFVPIPGQEGGNANAVATVTGCVMIDNTKKGEPDQDKKDLAAWQFMKWYTGNEFQSDYANEIVSILGVAARPATANREALVSLPWNNEELKAIEEQFNKLTAVQNHPGSYYLARYVNFAFLAAYNDGEDAANALAGYATDVNKEITRRREEFGMMTFDTYKEKNPDLVLTPKR
ncbi:MAG: extracellular solute-binding protein [Clostridia bacterium]|nr:extracellular solute-binding protein [Clostridia bacterium]